MNDRKPSDSFRAFDPGDDELEPEEILIWSEHQVSMLPHEEDALTLSVATLVALFQIHPLGKLTLRTSHGDYKLRLTKLHGLPAWPKSPEPRRSTTVPKDLRPAKKPTGH